MNDNPKLKVIIRSLPHDFTETDFFREYFNVESQEHLPNEVLWTWFVPGSHKKNINYSSGAHDTEAPKTAHPNETKPRSSYAYIYFANISALQSFASSFYRKSILENGVAPMIEYAPIQRMPLCNFIYSYTKSTAEHPTICKDSFEFLEFKKDMVFQEAETKISKLSDPENAKESKQRVISWLENKLKKKDHISEIVNDLSVLWKSESIKPKEGAKPNKSKEKCGEPNNVEKLKDSNKKSSRKVQPRKKKGAKKSNSDAIKT